LSGGGRENPTVLLIEDDKELLDNNTLMLELSGYEVAAATELTRAKAIIASRLPRM